MELPGTIAPPLPSDSAAAPPARRGGGKRAALLVLALAAVITIVYFSPLRSWLSWLRDPDHRDRVVQSLGIWTYPISILCIGVLVACGMPRLLLCTIAGVMLGFWGGLLVGEIGTVLGYFAVFSFVRWGGRDWALHRWPKLHKWADLARDQGVMGIILLRQMPIHGTFTNLGLGLSRIKQRQFVIGTAIGVIPESIPATLVGTGLVKGSPKAIAGWLAIAAVVFAIIWIICGYALRKMRNTPAGADLIAEENALNDSDQAGGSS
jgi:uncharacterized membrane protein YdjX (TVP38/TMEM64 family)